MKHKLLTTGILLAALTAPLHSATAAEGATSVSINLPDIIILHYLKNIDLSFDSKDLSVAEGGAEYSGDFGAVSLEAGIKSGSLTSVAKIDKPITVSIKNAYAVRGLSKSGSASVKGVISSSDAENGSSIVTMGDMKISTDKIALKGLALDSAVSGDVQFSLDLSKSTSSGLHKGGEYIITANGI